ncbi:MAG: hypothetical protein GKR90_15065 [Pseudomonadales bacterium]|nr:hypothetical protein [Pseudomonadales bacterium]
MENPNEDNQAPNPSGSNPDEPLLIDEVNQPDDGDSLEDWINRAKRAHELVDAVDLKKVTEHDEIEIAKVATVGSALQDLEQGQDVGHVEGVDEVVPEMDESMLRRAGLIEALSEAGFADRISRVLSVHGDAMDLRPLDLIPHSEGLPEYDLCVAPEQVSLSGHFGLFVSRSGVFAASIADPPSKHHWRIAKSRPYDNNQELMENLAVFGQSGFE